MVDTKLWVEKRLGDIFKSYTGGDLILNQVQPGEIPVVSHTMVNNGVSVYSAEIENRKLFDCHRALSLADRGTFFAAVQLKDFYIGTRVKALEFMDGCHSENVMNFFATIINNEKFRFCYGRNCTSGIDDLVVRIPVLTDGSPDYEYIEKYMSGRNIVVDDIPDYFLGEGYEKACWYLDNIEQDAFEKEYAKSLDKANIKLMDRKWDFFRLGDYVEDVHNGKSYNTSDLIPTTDGDDYISYVTRTDQNNGIGMFVEPLEYDGLEKGGAITIGDTTATIFYQEHDFITGPHIIVLRADWFNVYTANFIITMLEKEKYRYPAFGRAFTKDLIKDTMLYLPMGNDNKPDYQFMEQYVRKCLFSGNISS